MICLSRRPRRWSTAPLARRAPLRAPPSGNPLIVPVARQTGKQLKILDQEPRQPHAFATALLADQVHAVVPVAAAHQRQPVGTEAHAVLEGTHAVLVEAGRFGRALRLGGGGLPLRTHLP